MATTDGAMIRPYSGTLYDHTIRNVIIHPIYGASGVHSAPNDGCIIDGLYISGGGQGTEDGYALLVGQTSFTAWAGLYSNIMISSFDGNGIEVDDAELCVFSNIVLDTLDTHGIVLDNGAHDNVFNGIRIEDAGRVNDGDSIRIVDGNRNVFDAIHIAGGYHRTAVDFSGGVGNILGTAYVEAGRIDTYLETTLYDNDFGLIIEQPWVMPEIITVKTGALRFPILFDADILEVVIVDVHLNDTTIFPTQGDRPTIATSGFGDKAEPTNPILALTDDYLTVDVDQKDSNDVASDLLVVVRLRRRKG